MVSVLSSWHWIPGSSPRMTVLVEQAGAAWPPHNLFVACAVPQKSRCSHSALVENLESHDRTNGVEAGAGEAAGTALKVVCHIERIFRTG